MMNEFFDWSAWSQWFAGLEREYVFLLALPFVVAVIGLWSWLTEKEDLDREYEQRAAQADEREGRQRERRQGARRRADSSGHHSLS